jgi:hypothetical protein
MMAKKNKANKIKKIKAFLKLRATAKKKNTVQPQGRARKKPGTTGKGKFYRVVIRPKSEFKTFRNHDVGKKGHIERLAGQRANGKWATQAWLISKKEAKVVKGILVGKNKDVKDVLSKLRRKPKQVKGDVFEAGPRINVPEKAKPTPAMKKAQAKNIKKAQAARKKKAKKK